MKAAESGNTDTIRILLEHIEHLANVNTKNKGEFHTIIVTICNYPSYTFISMYIIPINVLQTIKYILNPTYLYQERPVLLVQHTGVTQM